MSDYPAGMTLRPIEHWPGTPTANRVASQFSAPWRSTLHLLDRELWHLGRGNRNAPAVLQIAMREQDFRQDGMPRANAKSAHPGVILAIESNKGPLSFPCDKFTTWQDNLRAIALALEALRKVDRYGITPNDEQYTGWKQLGSAPTSAPGLTDLTNACSLLARIAWPNEASDAQAQWSHRISSDRQIAQSTYRQARIKAHPDRHGGDQTDWDAIEAAADVLRNAGRL